MNIRYAVRVHKIGGRPVAPGDQTYTVGTAIATLTLPEASDGDGPLTYSLSPEVPGLTFSPSTRQLTGIPTTAASHNMIYTVRDGDDDTDTLSFTITVVEPDLFPSFPGGVTIADQAYTVGRAIATLLPEASGGDGTLTYSLSPEVPGLTFSPSTRRLTGIPTTAASHNMIYRVRDGDDDTDTLNFTITVEDRIPLPSFPSGVAIADQTYTVGTAIATLTLPEASGGDGTLTYSLISVGQGWRPSRWQLAPGLTFNPSTRQLTGIPTTAVRDHRMGYKVRDEDGDTDAIYFTITVEDPGLFPRFLRGVAIADQNYTVGTAIATLTLPEAASDGDGTLTYRLRVISRGRDESPYAVPREVPGLTFNPSTRQLTGIPTTAGSYTLVYRVFDEDIGTDAIDFTITVVPD